MALRDAVLATANHLLGSAGFRLARTSSDQQVNPQVTNNGRTTTYERISILRYAPWLDDPEFTALYAAVKNHTLVDVYRCYELWDLTRQVSSVEGDILEVGVWRGGTGAVLADGAKRWKAKSSVILCDTFAGVVKAGAFDETYRGGEHADTSVEIVKGLLEHLHLANCRILRGTFPDQVEGQMPEKIALCHIDVDVYESARAIVEWVAPRLSPTGVLVFDDYGFYSCPGVTRLVDEIRQSARWQFVYNLNGHAALTARW